MTMTATYSPEDNKLRLYAMYRLSKEDYARVKAAGFKWAPKQELFVAPSWMPGREDLLLELCGEIGDEDYSMTERSADRAERFEGYRGKRVNEAGGAADRFESGPSAFGHQNQARAERQAERHDRHRTYAGCQWSKAEYWQSRTEGVIRHMLYKSSAAVRRSRILRLEADQRKHEKNRAEYAMRFKAWSKVPTLEGADKPGRHVSREDFIGFEPESMTPALKVAYALANSHYCWGDYLHPRTGAKGSMYRHLTDEADPITPAEAAALWLEHRRAPDDPDSRDARWSRHYELRLTYERAMLAAEGGTAADADMEPGGWIGKHQIHAVNRSPVTGKVVSVKIMGETTGYTKESGYTKRETRPCLVLRKVERLPEGAYRPPTDEERAAFAKETKERKAAEKASKPKVPPLVNPTEADAERLQALWNAAAKAKHDQAVKEHRTYGEYKPSEVRRMTQAEYSARSKGSYSYFETRMLHACGRPSRRYTGMYSESGERYDKSLGAAVCKLRVCPSGHSGYSPRSVIVLTDKPQKPLGLDWEAIAAGTVPAAKAEAAPEPVTV